MDPRQQKEQFSFAYVHAVATVAGYPIYRFAVDDDSVDLGIGDSRSRRAPRLELQLKCTGSPDWQNDILHFPLKKKNYDELRGDADIVPRILVVTIVPHEVENWIEQSETELALRRCAYWLSLREEAASPNTTSVTVKVPRAQQFNVESLTGMMNGVSVGVRP